MAPKKMNKPNHELKKVAIYCRVSTYNQGQGEYSSLDTQEDLLRSYAQLKGWAVYKAYIDTKTGSTLERDAISQLLEDAKQRKFDILLATKLDRISRNMKDFFEINEILLENNIDIVMTSQPIDTTSSMGKFNRNMLLAFAEFERDMIAERTREKLYNQAQKGYWGGGNVILGYTVVDKKLVIVETEAALVKRIFNDYLAQPSTYKLAQKLNAEGFRTKMRMTKSGKTAGGVQFDNQNVRDILRNKLYIGYITFNGEQFKGLHQPIIEEALFQRVQESLQKSREEKYITHEDSELLLLGLVKCGFCEKGLSTSFARKENKKYYYYKCLTKTKLGAANCEERDIPADQVETLIEKLIGRLGDDDGFFDAVYRQAAFNEDTEVIALKEKIKQLTENRSTVNREIKNVNNFIAKAPSDFDSSSTLVKIKELQESLKEVEKHISETERRIQTFQGATVAKDNLRMVYKKINELYGKLQKPVQRKLIQALIQEIQFKYKKSEPTGLIRLGFRGDGTVEEEWFKNINLETLVSRFYVQWLRG
jgi:site-specific DNA recombinase